MRWYQKRVWQMGLGALLALLGAMVVYIAAAGEPVRPGWMWVGLGLIFFGLFVPLLTRIFEAAQEREGEHGES